MTKSPVPWHLRQRERITIHLNADQQRLFTRHRRSLRNFLDCLLIDLVDDTGEPDGDERWWIQQYFKIWKAEGRSRR
jgi:hypothetical protein